LAFAPPAIRRARISQLSVSGGEEGNVLEEAAAAID
jgi:hypothetical protein